MIAERQDTVDVARATWRLLDNGGNDGATNMAIDEAILIGIIDGTSPPTLRFYGWEPPCVSIGYAQSMRSEVDLEACRQRGYTWVRRPTGGRAVLHIDEVTYSVAAAQTEPRVAGDIITSYRRLSLGLVAGLQLLGCDVAQAHEPHQPGPGSVETTSAACFDVPSHYEITALGRKLVGSAQVRRRGVVLQHGALPLRGDVARLADVLALSGPERQALRAKLLGRAITLENALGRDIPFDRVVPALAEGFSRALNLELAPGTLSAVEHERAARLREKYASDEWTFSR
ncbi:MAG: lipoate--protein ligase family protein [Anaerolineae bacterium]|nr:lipoate--protein ligase family protein [Anaerolineae bacterium]